MLMLQMWHDATHVVLAVDTITPESPPQSDKWMQLARYFLWFVELAGALAVIACGLKFMWEKWSSGEVHAPKQLGGIAVGCILAVSAAAIVNTITGS